MSYVDVEKYRSDNYFVGQSPTPEAMKCIRMALGLSQTAAARTIYILPSSWSRCEQGWGNKKLSPALWELFLIKNWRRIGRSQEEIIEISRGVVGGGE